MGIPIREVVSQDHTKILASFSVTIEYHFPEKKDTSKLNSVMKILHIIGKQSI